MEIRDLIKTTKNLIEKDKIKLEERKHNISSDYLLAKLDFVVIENYTDSVETLEKIYNDLEELQNRIIERNRRKN